MHMGKDLGQRARSHMDGKHPRERGEDGFVFPRGGGG
jgi:hypothetical protein